MRSTLSTAIVVTALLPAARAHAMDHLMKVNEVLVDGGGGEQFVEFHDTSPETLPTGPYTLAVYDADGNQVGTSLELTGITAGSGIFYVAGNAAAASTYGAGNIDVQFTFTLPANGQACFVRGTGGKIHCMLWGCINNPVVLNGSTTDPPPVGSSISRQATGEVHITDTPTPGAPNGTGTVEPACPQAVVDAGPTADANPFAPDANPFAPDANPFAPDANPFAPDAGDGGGDGGGCCRGSTPGGSAGSALLALAVLVVVTRRRR